MTIVDGIVGIHVRLELESLDGFDWNACPQSLESAPPQQGRSKPPLIEARLELRLSLRDNHRDTWSILLILTMRESHLDPRAIVEGPLANRAAPHPPQGWLECVGTSSWLPSESGSSAILVQAGLVLLNEIGETNGLMSMVLDHCRFRRFPSFHARSR